MEDYNLEAIRGDNIIIGYHNDKAIIENEYGALFFMECEKNWAPVGTIAEDHAIKPITSLTQEEQIEIIQNFVLA